MYDICLGVEFCCDSFFKIINCISGFLADDFAKFITGFQ
jgi:hypothetical protein